MVYAPAGAVEARNYGVARYGMEVQRLLDVLDKQLEGKTYIVNEEYTIADIMCFPWVNQVRTGYVHSSGIGAKDFLGFDKYVNINRWLNLLLERPAVQRGMKVCSNGVGKPWLTVESDLKK